MNGLPGRLPLFRIAFSGFILSTACVSPALAAPPSNPLRATAVSQEPAPAVVDPQATPLRPAAIETTAAARVAASSGANSGGDVIQASGLEDVTGPALAEPANRRYARTPTRQVTSRTVLVPPSRAKVNLQDERAAPQAADAPSAAPGPASSQTPSLKQMIEEEVPLSQVPMSGEYGEEWYPGDEPIYANEMCMDGPCDSGCLPACLSPWGIFTFQNLELSVGTQGFTGPPNRGETGSFGFYEGFNYGRPLHCFCDALSGQFGLNVTQSNLSGAASADDDRQQLFLTGGLFRRVDWGLQGGLVIDYISEEWYAHYDLTQLRGELSWVFPCHHELGFWFTAGLDDDLKDSVLGRVVRTTTAEQWETTDLYAFYYRRRFDQCGAAEGRFSAGFTGNGDGLLNADFRLPLHDKLAVNTGFTYLVPTEAEGSGIAAGHGQEGWNVFLGLTWYPGCNSAYGNSYSRPLLNVANNGTLMVDRVNR